MAPASLLLCHSLVVPHADGLSCSFAGGPEEVSQQVYKLYISCCSCAPAAPALLIGLADLPARHCLSAALSPRPEPYSRSDLVPRHLMQSTMRVHIHPPPGQRFVSLALSLMAASDFLAPVHVPIYLDTREDPVVFRAYSR